MINDSAASAATDRSLDALTMPMAPSTAAMKKVLGVSASTCSYSDWYGSDVVVSLLGNVRLGGDSRT